MFRLTDDDKAYYKVLKDNGYEKANQVPQANRNAQLEIYNKLKEKLEELKFSTIKDKFELE